jgi:hypothetical protein
MLPSSFGAVVALNAHALHRKSILKGGRLKIGCTLVGEDGDAFHDRGPRRGWRVDGRFEGPTALITVSVTRSDVTPARLRSRARSETKPHRRANLVVEHL